LSFDVFVVVEHTKKAVPDSCCKKDQYGEYIDQNKCQRWILGPPYKPGGQLNEALFYKVVFNYSIATMVVSLEISGGEILEISRHLK